MLNILFPLYMHDLLTFESPEGSLPVIGVMDKNKKRLLTVLLSVYITIQVLKKISSVSLRELALTIRGLEDIFALVFIIKAASSATMDFLVCTYHRTDSLFNSVRINIAVLVVVLFAASLLGPLFYGDKWACRLSGHVRFKGMRPTIVTEYCNIIVYCKLFALITFLLFYFFSYYRSLEIPDFNNIYEFIGFCQLNSDILLEAS